MADQKLKFVAEWVDKGLKKGAADAEKAVKGADKSTKSLASTYALAATAAAAVAVTIKQLYSAAKEGAQIELATVRFDRLAESIGSTGDAMREDLKDATDGLLSQADSVKLAGDLMSLGLAKTHDHAIRLSAVASQLGMDMNQLTLTLSNQTTRRFDSLGVAVSGFDDKLQAMKETGKDVNEAFTEAFLLQAEEQIEKVGSVADTTAGQMMMLEASWEDFTDSVKVGLASSIGPQLTAFNRINELQNKGLITWLEARKMFQAYEKDTSNVNKELERLENMIGDTKDSAAASLDTWGEIADYYGIIAEKADEAAEAQSAFMQSIENVNTSLGNQIEQMIENIEWNERGGPVFQQAYDTIIAGAGTAAEKQKQLTNLAINYMTVMGELDGMSIEQIASQIEDLGVDMDLAWRLAMGVYGQLNKINGMEVSADVFINVHGKVPKLGTGGGVIQGYGEGASGAGGIITDMPIIQQAGGDFIVPPQFAGDSMPIRATAGERVKVDTASNTTQDNIAAMFQNQNFAQQIGKTIARELIRQGV